MNRRAEVTIWINGRFLQRPVTGVERVARELLTELSPRLDRDGRLAREGRPGWRFRLLVPASGEGDSPWPNLPLVRGGAGAGHLWEQASLPWLTRDGWLLSLCNTGPLFKRRQLLFLHDAQVFAIPDNFTWRFRTWYRILFGLAGRRARILATNSQFSRSELVRRAGLDPARFTLVPLGADHVLRDAPAPVQGGEGPFLLAVASLSPNKNLRLVQEALALLGPEAPPCVLVGKRCDEVFRAPALSGLRIRHAGHVQDPELYGLYRQALCLVFPSFYEGFGLPPLEAMALGCPVIVARSGALPEVCAAAALYCDPRDPATLAQAIRALQGDPRVREQFRLRGLARAARFTWARGMDALLEGLGKELDREEP
jgi:glycosyltransferase involved in cell wall biosynthesis